MMTRAIAAVGFLALLLAASVGWRLGKPGATGPPRGRPSAPPRPKGPSQAPNLEAVLRDLLCLAEQGECAPGCCQYDTGSDYYLPVDERTDGDHDGLCPVYQAWYIRRALEVQCATPTDAVARADQKGTEAWNDGYEAGLEEVKNLLRRGLL